MIKKLKAFGARLRRDLIVLHLAARHSGTPWYAKTLAACVAAYALSPIDLIPDMIPVLGQLDDLILVPLGIYLAIRLIPPEVVAECRARAAAKDSTLPRNWRAAAAIIIIWLLAMILAGYYLSEFVFAC